MSFFDHPILYSPYLVPPRHHVLDADGQPLALPPIEGRRRSELITPVPKPRKRKNKAAGQGRLGLGDDAGLSTEDQEYNPTPIINEIRQHVASWRELKNPADWGVTPATARLLTHWRSHNFEGVRPFFCQVEAVETIIWLTEVARRETRYAKFWEHIRGANEQANPELVRIAMKMATGSGKTTVMAMLIAWQTVNAVRQPTSTLFSRGFLDWSDLVVPAPPLYIQEKVHPKAIIDDLVRRTKQEARSAERATGKETTPDLFGDFNGIAPEARTEFCQHDQHWSNRMILGDSLYVRRALRRARRRNGEHLSR